ncbi:DUF1330 domain-containing protein [Fulvivirgaceae bacterium BMA12]|uniref:DUF1330 domain-containing protein n=1 Tax=Agaribacillus aureus TaxID=3051825 RepID=A0ABT8LAH9_9BACT|nr:DUF1330 domain-containing protein [Fulvivirgaceae bacterium BMA12]
MSAYCLFDNLTVKDPEKLEMYKSQVLSIVEKYQGKYVVLGGETEVVEGAWKPTYLVMIEFPSLALAKEWYHSEDYKALKALRLSATDSSAVIIQGL